MPILLVEDNPADAYLVKVFLNEASVRHDLVHTETLFEGIDVLREREIQMILLDLTLPDSQGFKTLTSLLERITDVPVIVMTGLNNEIVGNQAVKAGAQDFLVKGQFDGKLLGRSIRYAQQRFKEQKKKEEILANLSSSEKRYSEAQTMGHFGNWQMDIVTNEMVWTDEVYRIFGSQPGGIQPTMTSYLSFVHPEDKLMVEDFFENAMKNGKQHHLEHRLVLNGISVKYTSVTAKINVEEQSGKIYLVGIVQDITERKVAEKLLVEKNLSLKSNRIKEEVLADMSFHIRTPLSTIVNLLFLMDSTAISSQQKELLDGLRTSVDDLGITINNLLNLSILVSEKMKIEDETFVVRDFLHSVKKLVQIKADNAGVRVQYEFDKHLPDKCIGDVKKLTQIIYNLLNNSIRLCDRNGEIRVDFSMLDIDDKTSTLECKIQDNGRVMSEEKIKDLLDTDRLLKAYSETDNTGDEKMHEIGVAIVSKLTSILDGQLSIVGTENIGNLYKFSAPVKISKTVRLKPGEAPNSPLRILLVEDHFLNQIATKKILTTWSDYISVDIAENGLIGVEKHREYNYNLILMDIQMPVMNGLESTKRIRERSEVPIIALTANASRSEMEKCLEMGMNDYLAKPFKPQDLYAKIMGLLAVQQS
jgi:DNA-binding response OmpR family regulator/signal transduction histidine kinase